MRPTSVGVVELQSVLRCGVLSGGGLGGADLLHLSQVLMNLIRGAIRSHRLGVPGAHQFAGCCVSKLPRRLGASSTFLLELREGASELLLGVGDTSFLLERAHVGGTEVCVPLTTLALRDQLLDHACSLGVMNSSEIAITIRAKSRDLGCLLARLGP